MIEPPPERSRLQESIFRALQRAEPALADLYEGARQLVAAETQIPGQSWLFGHAVRELVDHIPKLGGVGRKGGFDCGQRLEAVGDAWKALGLLDDADDPQADGVTEVDGEAIAVVARLVRDNWSHRNRQERLRTVFAERAPHVGPARHKAWAQECMAIYGPNAKRAHTGEPRAAPQDDRRLFGHLETILAGIFGEYVPNRQELDAILAEANTTSD